MVTARGQRSSGRLRIAAVTAALIVSACGSDKNETQKDAAGSGSGHTVKIGVIAPLSGPLGAAGVGVRNSVDLAITQANDAGKIKGWKIVIAPADDTARPNVGGQAASKLASDRAVVGVVGTVNSSVAQQVQPILDRAGIVMVSPANTNPTLTQGADPANKARPYKTYFRVAATDAIQGPFAADYAYDTAGFKKAVVIHDKKTYGQGLADAFKARFEERGGKVLTVETVDTVDQKFDTLLSKVKPLGGDFIYYGGEAPTASLISAQADGLGLKIPLMGGDGIFDKTYIEVAGAAGEGDLATSVGAPPELLESAKSFVDAYRAAGYTDDYAAFGAYAYDAANVIINALAKVLPEGDRIDRSVLTRLADAVQKTDFDGATGHVSFDEYGDTTTRVFTVYKVANAAWAPRKTAAFD